MEWVLTILIFFAVIVLTAVLFVGWLIFSVVRAVVGGVVRLFVPRPSVGRPSVVHGERCMRERCQAINPSGARFCRRCGRLLRSAQRVPVSRAAVW
jgi:hypothetical protein